MSYRDPQNAPDTWLDYVRLVTDSEGLTWVLAIDQDGEERLVEPEDWREYQHWLSRRGW